MVRTRSDPRREAEAVKESLRSWDSDECWDSDAEEYFRELEAEFHRPRKRYKRFASGVLRVVDQEQESAPPGFYIRWLLTGEPPDMDWVLLYDPSDYVPEELRRQYDPLDDVPVTIRHQGQ